MRSIVRWCLGNRAVVILFGLILMGAGVASAFRINQELLPSIDFPGVFIVTADPGASAEVVDRDVSIPIGTALEGTPGMTHVTTSSSQGFSTVAVEFALDTSIKDDSDAVNQRLAQVRLPDGVGKPNAQTFSFSSIPSMTYTLVATDGNLARATAEARDVVAPALQGASGAAQVKVIGGEAPAVTIVLDPARMAAAGVSFQQVSAVLGAAQVDVPAGTTQKGPLQLPVEVLTSVRSAADLGALVVGARPAAAGPPSPVRLADVATITSGTAPVNGISRTDGSPSLSIQVVRAPNGNAVTLSDDVSKRVAALKLNPADRLTLVNDSATGIRASLNDLLLEGLIGAALAIAVIFLFLRSLRATLVTAVSLPTSVLVALLGTQVAGFSLNVLTLAGLTIAVGRIVDDAIVVLENSYRHLQMGETPREAALNGASEVSRAVVSSTLTTVAVFLPIGFVGGIISKFFLPFSVTVTIALLASLLVALTLIPVLVSFLLARASVHESGGRPASVYRGLLAGVLGSTARKVAVVAVAAALLAGSVGVVVAFVPKNFFSFGSTDQLTGTITLPPGTSTADTSTGIRRFEDLARTDPGVKLVSVTLSSSSFQGFTGGFNTNEANVSVIVRDRTQAQAVADRLKKGAESLYGAGNVQLAPEAFGPPSSGFSVAAKGRDPEALRVASDAIVAELARDSELADVKSNLAAEKPEVKVTVDPARAAAHGLAPKQVAFAVAAALAPTPLGTLPADGSSVSMLIDPAATAAGRLASLPVGPGVALGDVATISDDLAPQEIRRVDGTRQLNVTATVRGSDVSGASNRADARLKALSMPSGVTLETGGGTSADINSSFTAMFEAMAVAIGIVFIILVAFFRSVVTPFVILLTMPLALIGGLLALWITGQPLGLPALLGVLMVFGIVVSNAILLVDFVERAAPGTPLRTALLEGGATRLRPILMTAVATIAALVPVAAGVSTSGGGGLISQGLAVVVEGGLVSSTGLTLLVIPIVYSRVRRGAWARAGRGAAEN